MGVRYDHAKSCRKSAAIEAMVAMGRHYEATTGRAHWGIHVCRHARGQTFLSVHAEGRAIDLPANAHNPLELSQADDYVAWLQENVTALQVQLIIWNRRKWSDRYGWRPYTGVSPHTDHLHVEVNHDARDNDLYHSLPQGDWLMALNDRQQQELYDRVQLIYKGLFGTSAIDPKPAGFDLEGAGVLQRVKALGDS